MSQRVATYLRGKWSVQSPNLSMLVSLFNADQPPPIEVEELCDLDGDGHIATAWGPPILGAILDGRQSTPTLSVRG